MQLTLLEEQTCIEYMHYLIREVGVPHDGSDLTLNGGTYSRRLFYSQHD